MNLTVRKIVIARREAAAGVDFSPRVGALCPWCHRKAKGYRTLPWEDATRIRYHRCENHDCPISTMNVTIKSIEVDRCGEETGAR